MYSYLSPEQRVPADHPLRSIRKMTDRALKDLSRKFNAIYATTGRPSIPPEKLLRALLLQVLYTVRSERLLMEQLEYNLLFGWFVELNIDEPVMGADGVQQESGSIARWRHRGEVFPWRTEASARGGLIVGRALQRGWNTDGSLGESEKFSTQGRRRRADTRRSGQSDGELSWRETEQRDT